MPERYAEAGAEPARYLEVGTSAASEGVEGGVVGGSREGVKRPRGGREGLKGPGRPEIVSGAVAVLQLDWDLVLQ